MRRVVVINFKGGVGKTTTAVNVSFGLAELGFHVLLVDNDPQANATFVLDRKFRYSLTEVYREEVPLEQAIVNVRPNLDLIPASKSLSNINTWLIENSIPNRAQVLDRVLARAPEYDFMIMDTAPSFSLLNANAISYAREAWVPVAMEYLALANVRELIHVFSRAEVHLARKIPISNVIPYFVDSRNKKTRQIMRMLQDIFGDNLTNPIHTNVKVSEACFHFKTVLEYDPESRGAKDFRLLIRKIVEENSRYQSN
ncbi:MAG TPA: ParA family protein [Acidobacteriota bacterium]|nr:ParA family protein [Acidobacteriota bacterium]HOS99378.1 ParA family protein [Acidobacteriota bacterium]HQF86332.1 ParA family protein [Acidobacteriota bacterium]HQG90425.1 ParA family protein [Acidobacteriota bacterium]HQK86232.1 ParA family protein [Acidobacteriota bacterium]